MRILDLYCGAGGASVGLKQAFPDAKITGVDNTPQKHYPFRFKRRDAINYLCRYADSFDFIWASPPCQKYSQATIQRRQVGIEYSDDIQQLHDILVYTGKPYCIENVKRAPLTNTTMLCGLMFGLKLLRHRWFETNFIVAQPVHKKHTGLKRGIDYYSPVFGSFSGTEINDRVASMWQEAMGTYWMTKREMSQAIPPAYSRYIGQQYNDRQRKQMP